MLSHRDHLGFRFFFAEYHVIFTGLLKFIVFSALTFDTVYEMNVILSERNNPNLKKIGLYSHNFENGKQNCKNNIVFSYHLFIQLGLEYVYVSMLSVQANYQIWYDTLSGTSVLDLVHPIK